MKMIDALMANALRSLDSRAVAKSLCMISSALGAFMVSVEKRSLRTTLEDLGLSYSHELDGWTLPDAVWSVMCNEQPHLICYPLGENAERAVKKSLIQLTLGTIAQRSAKISPNMDQNSIQRTLARSMKTLGLEGVLKLFLNHYFFELCIDQLRRPRGDPRLDLSFWYHFSENGYFVSSGAEEELRQTLANQCEEKAEIFLPLLVACVKEKKLAKSEQQISRLLAETFDVSLSKEREVRSPRKPFLNIIAGTKSLSEIKKSHTLDERAKRILVHTKGANVSFSFEPLENFVGHRIHSLVRDLLDIGVITYMSDLYTKRERNLGRRVGILMPVRHPDIWSGVQTELERAVSFLGRDDFRIQFSKRKERTDRVRNFSPKSDNQCVCLLSGGLDSLAGAVWVLDNERVPIFVSHYSNPRLVGIQKPLVQQLERIYNRQLQHVKIYVARAKGKRVRYKLPAPFKSLMVQHLRSFLFLSLATATALETGVKDIYIFENGPVALNPLFSEARVNTRTAHPHFLEHYRALIRVVFGIELNIENPFIYRTKGEIVNILARSDLHGLVAKTISCWSWFRVPVTARRRGIKGFKGLHDGECSPCIIRRTAVNHARLWEEDAEYLTDVFNQFPNLRRETITTISDLIRFCYNMRYLSDGELLLRAPDFSVCSEGTESHKLVAMYRRHSEEILDCFRTRSNSVFRRIFASALRERGEK